MTAAEPVGPLLHSYFTDHLIAVKAVLVNIDRGPWRSRAVKTRKHPRSELANKITCGTTAVTFRA